MRAVVWRAGIVVALLVVPLFFTRSTFVIHNPGVDSFTTHLPLYGNRIIEQTFVSPTGTIERLELLLVPMSREAPAGAVELTVLGTDGVVVWQSTLSAAVLRDDTFRAFPLAEPLAVGRQTPLTLRIAAPEARSGAPVGVRYDPDPQRVPEGRLAVNGTPVDGALALRVAGPVNFYQEFLHVIRQQSAATLQRLAVTTGLAGLVAAVAMWVRHDAPVQLFGRRLGSRLLLASLGLCLVVLPWRLTMVDEIRGYSGGDPFNFFFITQRIVTEGQFYHPAEKRLPFFPFLLAPTLWWTDDILASARHLNQIFAAAALLGLAAAGRKLGLPPEAVWLGVVFTALNRDFLFIPYRPEPYLLVGALLLAGLALLWRGKQHVGWLVAAGVVFGLAGQTRQEGALAGGVIVALTAIGFLRHKQWRPALALALPFALLLLPYLVANFVFFGNPFYTAYLDHPVTTLDKPAAQILDQVRHALDLWGSTWWPTWDLLRAFAWDRPMKWLLALLLGGGLFATAQRRGWIPLLPSRAPVIILSVLASGLIVHRYLLHQGEVVRIASLALALASVAGLVLFVLDVPRRQDGWRRLILLAGFGSILGLVVWSEPAAKKLVSLTPVLGLLAGVAVAALLRLLHSPQETRAGRIGYWLGATALLLPLCLPLTVAARTLPLGLDIASHKYVEEYLLYQAHRYLGAQTGLVGMRHTSLSAQYFLPRRVVQFPETSVEPTEADLAAQDITWLVVYSEDPLFASYAAGGRGFAVAATWRGEDKDNERVVIQVLRRKTPFPAAPVSE